MKKVRKTIAIRSWGMFKVVDTSAVWRYFPEVPTEVKKEEKFEPGAYKKVRFPLLKEKVKRDIL